MSKLKYYTNLVIDGAHSTPTYVDDGVPFLRVTDLQNQNIDFNFCKKIPKVQHDELHRRCKAEKGDVLFSKTGTIGVTRVVSWNQEFSFFVSLALLKPKSILNNKFLSYFLSCSSTLDYINSELYGSAQQNIPLENIKNLPFPHIDIHLQNQIVNFLDKKTSAIDRLVEKKIKLVELLKQKRKILINNTVTKGLDPNVEFKDSRIDWIGKIPVHWKLIKLKNIVDNIESEKANSIYSLIVCMENVEKRSGKLLDIPVKKILWKSFKENDILFGTMNSHFGKVYYANRKGNFYSEFIQLRTNTHNINSKFIYYRLLSTEFVDNISKFQIGVKMPRTPDYQILKQFFYIPTIHKQNLIVEFLDNKTNKIDSAIKKLETQINSLKEYRKILINDVVTGKIDVT